MAFDEAVLLQKADTGAFRPEETEWSGEDELRISNVDYAVVNAL